MTDSRDIMSDGLDWERRVNTKALWQCVGLFAISLALTVLSYVRPDWITLALFSVTFFFLILLAIGVQEMWSLRRGRSFRYRP